MTRRLPRPAGAAPRVALVVYNQVSTDSRVLKTADALADAGADVLILGSAREPRHPAGADVTGSGIPIRRVRDFDLATLLPWLATAIRRRRNARAADQAARLAAAAGPRATPAAAQPSAPPVTAPPLRVPVAIEGAWLRLYGIARLTWFWLGVSRELVRWRPDVVHANDGNTLAPAMLVRLVRRSAIVYDAHELWTRRNVRQDRLLAPLVESLIERLGVRAAAGVVTVSPSIVTWMRRRFRLRVPPTLVRNIPHRTRAVPGAEQGRLRELAGLTGDDRVVGYCGGVTTGRGLEETVDALRWLPGHVHLVMLGYGEAAYIASLFERASALGVADRLHLVGPVPSEAVPRTLADADVSVVYVRPICLSYEYSLPNKLFESIHGGLPVVAADLPDTAAIVERYGIGLVFSHEKPDRMAAAIEEVLADPARYRQASAAAAQELDWSHEADRLLALYDGVLRRRSGR